MTVRNVVAVGDDQEWKRAVEEELAELRSIQTAILNNQETILQILNRVS